MRNQSRLIRGSTRGAGGEEVLDLIRFAAHEDETRRAGAVVAEVHAQRIRTARARVELGRMIGEQASKRVAMADWISGEAGSRAELGKTAVRTADTGALEVVDIDVGKEMETRVELDQF